ncbi:MAG: hypothetical protein ACP5OJ_06845 [Methanothermobacter sp.]
MKAFLNLVGIDDEGVVGPVTLSEMKDYTVNPTSLITLTCNPDIQDNGYQCGPSPLKMAFSVYKLTLDETWLASVA